MAEQSGMIFNIQRFSIHDGPGIRTTVFMKGCGMRCIWCHNPESWDGDREVAYYLDKCIGCGACTGVCPAKCHFICEADGVHIFNRQDCVIKCGKCADICCTDALKIIGRRMTAAEVFEEIKKDDVFYESSGGGVTLSGGEPMFQPKFTEEILKRCKDSGIHTCIETSGLANPEMLLNAAKYADLFLFDIKETDAARHKKYTGSDNKAILENLYMLDKTGAKIILRCPIIPEINDREEHFAGIARIADSLNNIQKIEVEPYHSMGLAKAQAVGKILEYTETELTKKEVSESWVRVIRKHTDVDVSVSV